MARLTSLTLSLPHEPLELLRALIVSASALALILAGRALPF
jgi:hypothetical protein